MRNKSVMIAAAVAAALGSQGAQALSGPDSLAAPVKLVVSGASAQKSNFRARLFTDLCQSGTFDAWQLTDGNANTSEDFAAYSCTTNTNATGLTNTNVLVYYRSEGGSVYGVGPVLSTNPSFATGVKRLVLSDSTAGGFCASFNSAGLGATDHSCNVAGAGGVYTLATDSMNIAGVLTGEISELGISDVEPLQFIAPNWPKTGDSVLGSPPLATDVALSALDTASVNGSGTTFGVLTSESIGGTSNATELALSISREQLATIFTGSVSDWTKIINQNTGLAVTTTPTVIRVCRRERGSGTQVSAQAYFLQTNCTDKYTLSMPDGGDPLHPNFVDNNTSGAMSTCVATANSIGFASYGGAISGANWIQIDKVSPSRFNAASGLYGFHTETTMQTRPGLAGSKATLAGLLISNSQKRASLVAGATGNSFAIPGVGGNVASIALASADPPLAIGKRDKKTCSPRGNSLP